MVNDIIRLDVIIPFFNEEDNIKDYFDSLLRFFTLSNKFSNLDIGFIIVDNGSTDSTNFKISENLKKFKYSSHIKLIKVQNNLGYGYGICQGLKETNKDFVAWTHSDGQTDIIDILKGIQYLVNAKKNNNLKILIKGKRINRQIIPKIISFFMEIIIFLFTGKYLLEINAQPKIFDKNLKNLLLSKPPNDFNLDLHLILLANQNKYKTINIPVYFKKRIGSKAKGGGNLKNILKISLSTINYLYKRNK